MATVHHEPLDINSTPWDAPYRWECDDDSPPMLPAPDGLAWLTDLSNQNHPESTDPTGARALAGSAFCDLCHDIRFHRARTIAQYLDSPHTRPSVEVLVALTVPGPDRRVSGFAAALDRLAEEYLGLGTVAGRLAAWAIEDIAHEVEWYGSNCLREWEIDRAAFREAMVEMAAHSGVEF